MFSGPGACAIEARTITNVRETSHVLINRLALIIINSKLSGFQSALIAPVSGKFCLRRFG
jgi:hypothetical protein